jgi:hypothetical protein
LAAREARLQEVPWTLDPLDFRLIGQVTRSTRGPLWTYVHTGTGGELNVDDGGVPHRVRLDRAMRIRTKRIGLSDAIWGTGIPARELASDPPHRATHDGWESCDDCQAWLAEEESAVSPPRRRRSGGPPAVVADDVQPDTVVGERRLRLVR